MYTDVFFYNFKNIYMKIHFELEIDIKQMVKLVGAISFLLLLLL